MRKTLALSLSFLALAPVGHGVHAAPALTPDTLEPTSLAALVDAITGYHEGERPSAPLDHPFFPPPNYDAQPNIINIRPQDFNVRPPVPGLGFYFGGDTMMALADAPEDLFVMDPDRPETATTTRHDFFLSDRFADEDTRTAEIVVPPAGNDKIYLIDGNLWIDNPSHFSFILATQPGDASTASGTHITFVVQGNIFISDNLVYENVEKDAVAFIALKRAEDYPDEFAVPADGGISGVPARESSGNIEFGDPAFGATFRFSAFMFAESDCTTSDVEDSLFIDGGDPDDLEDAP